MEANVRLNQDARPMAELAAELNRIKDSGVSLQSIALETGVNRSYISTLVNRGSCAASAPTLEKLWAWVDAWKASQGMGPVQEGSVTGETDGVPVYKTDLTLIHTRDFIGALGFCDFCIKHREIGVVMGMPGTGKTTVVKTVADKLPHAIRIEAWLSMRMGDLLDEIAAGLGIDARGTLNSRTQKIIRTLRQQPDTVILVDEAEYLKKWNVEKMDVLRKIHDNAGVTVLLFGTPALANVLNRRDTTQLSRRMFQYTFGGARKDEIREALRVYNMDADVMERLASMAADTAHGGMGTYTKMLELCLFSAQGGRITEATLEEAVMYKPGL